MDTQFRRYAGIMFLAIILLLTACAPRTESTRTPAPSDNGSGPTATRVAPTATFVVNATFTPTVPLATTIPPTATTRPPAPSAAASNGNSGGTDFLKLHWDRLAKYDPIFRQSKNTDWQGWLKAAGVSWDTMSKDARQVEEETSPEGNVYIAGVQVDGCGIKVTWPNVVTTDVPARITSKESNSFEYKPDQRPDGNKSVLYTNVTACGPVTIWISGLSWGQFTSRLGAAGTTPVTAPVSPTGNTQPTATVQAQANTCMTLAKILENGSLITELVHEGQLAGAQIRLTKDWTNPTGWTTQRNATNVTSAKIGEVVSIWSDPACRPLPRVNVKVAPAA